MRVGLIAAQDRLELGAGLDKVAGVHGGESGQPVRSQFKCHVPGPLGGALRLGGQALHGAVVASHEMKDELAAERGEQGVRVIKFIAERMGPVERSAELRSGVSMNGDQRTSDCRLEREFLAIPLRPSGQDLSASSPLER